MSAVIWLAANTLDYPEGGGHQWVYLNWALGIRALGCKVIWLEGVDADRPPKDLRALLATLQKRLERYGLTDGVALCSGTDLPLPEAMTAGCRDLAESADADLLLNLSCWNCGGVARRFRRSALVDIDPGLLQLWLSRGALSLERYDIYFTIGETVGQPGALFPDCGVEWHYTPPCVALDQWSAQGCQDGAPFTTVSHWASSREWVWLDDEWHRNDKRTGFLPFLDLPRRTAQPLELALCLAHDEHDERQHLQDIGWRVQHAHQVASTPQDYQRYIQSSRGEFSCAKPSCIRLQNSWISDRTLCYLASGKPAVVQYTGRSRFLPDADGLFRFHDVAGAAESLERVVADYARHCRQAPALAEQYFDAQTVVGRVLERALD